MDSKDRLEGSAHVVNTFQIRLNDIEHVARFGAAIVSLTAVSI